MEDVTLKTIIYIFVDQKTGKPMVLSQFMGFETEQEAMDFTQVLQEEFMTPFPNDKITIH